MFIYLLFNSLLATILLVLVALLLILVLAARARAVAEVFGGFMIFFWVIIGVALYFAIKMPVEDGAVAVWAGIGVIVAALVTAALYRARHKEGA